jgi:hypothetical protein
MRFKSLLLIPVALLAAACGDDVPRPDDRDDLAWLDTLSITPVASPLESGFIEEEEPVDEAPQPRAASTRTSSSNTPRASRSSSSGVYNAPAPVRQGRVVTERHTVRDAAIGAGAGAVIGAVAGGSGNRTKGAIIGGAAGAVIGGVIGHTVDKKERIVYDLRPL